MRNRKEIENDISRLTQSQSKIQTELIQLEGAENGYLNQAGEDLIAGKEDRSTQVLADVRARKEILNHAFKLAGDKFQAAQAELQDLDHAEKVKAWDLFEKEIWGRLETIQGSIGVDGLKGQLDELYNRIRQARAQNLDSAVQDSQQKLSKLDTAWMTASRALYESWNCLEAARQYKPGYTPKSLADFGRLP